MKKRILFFASIVIFLLLSISFLEVNKAKRITSSFVSKVEAPDKTKALGEWSDGPYIFVEEGQVNAYYLCKGEVLKKSLNKEAIPLLFSYCNTSITLSGLNYQESNKLEYKGDYKIAAISDIHGQYSLAKKILQNNNIVDDKGDWIFENGHLVVTGDIFDRGDEVTETLWLLYKLEQQATSSGGAVHVLLGNHEVMILNGDLRYLHEKYNEASVELGIPYEELYGKDTILGRWLRSKPVTVKINNILFVHGGIHSTLAEEELTLSFINRIFKKNLVKNESLQPREGWGKYLHGKNGPVWYRGYFEEKNKCLKKNIDDVLQYYDVDHIVVGHTSQEQIETRHCDSVIAIDTSIKNGKYGELLFIQGENIWRGTLTGEHIPLIDHRLKSKFDNLISFDL